jgi:photosystem II stability/assembly factor-like uncharacterized protein
MALLGTIIVLALASSAANAQAAPPQPVNVSGTAPHTLAWRVVPPVTNIDLRDVHMVSSTDGWAVGGSLSENTRVVLRYNGTDWSVVSTGIEGVAVDVFMLSATNGYILTWVGTQGGRIYHYDGANWTLEHFTDATPNRVSAVSANDVWVAGLGKIYHWDGTQWSTAYVHPTLRNLFAIQMVSPTEGWATGAGSTKGGNGTILHYLNGTWSEYTPSPAPQTLYDCYFRTPTDGWAVGTAGNSYIVHYDGSQWSHLYTFPYFLDHIWITSPTDGWAIGQTNLLHYDGTDFTPVQSPTTLWSSSIFMLSPTDGWIVGESGLIMHYYDDTTPTPTLVPTFTPAPTFTSVPTSTATRTPIPLTSTPIAGTATPTPCAITFTDVPASHTFYASVHCLACRGIISGYADGTFKPDNLVTRGQLAKIVSNAAGFIEDPGAQIFQDVPAGHAFYEWVNRLTNRGYMSGYTCGSPGEPCIDNRPYFRPFANATRAQTSKIVSNAARYNDPPVGQTFEDVPTTHPFYVEIQRLASRGIMGGYNCGADGEPCVPPGNRAYFRPYNNVTRGQSAKIVANTFYPDCNTSAGVTRR